MSRRLALATLHALAACGPAPRSGAWFQAHPDIAAQVAARRRAAAIRAEDCENADVGLAAAQRDACMQMSGRSFAP